MYLERIEIENLRAIRSMQIDFRLDSAHTRRWTVLLGENGCGKSTVLKAIGLVLAGSEALPRLVEAVDEWIHAQATVARIRATLSTADGKQRKVALELRRGDKIDSLIKRNAKNLAELDAALAHADRNYFVVGYGAFRRPPSRQGRVAMRSSMEEGGRAANLATLFSTGQDLVSLEQWAMALDYEIGKDGLDVVADALGKLLPGMSFKRIDKRAGQIIMDTVDGPIPLRGLSEGYQAMAAWAGDILFRMTGTFGDWKKPLQARGVLLMDEMDLHLHPVWKRNFVDFMNAAFPNLQIIATTHSPLSIQQCGEGELYVVRRERDQPRLIAFQGDPSKLRLSELFLSPLIGLETLDSPKVAQLREAARKIELSGKKPSASEAAQLRELKQKLAGTTPLPVTEAPALAELMRKQEARLKAMGKPVAPKKAAGKRKPAARKTPRKAGKVR